MKQPKQIFDSRKARDVYKNHNYYRSSNFTIPPGYAALIELTTNTCNMCNISFQAMRIPRQEQECYITDCNFEKVYRRWRCSKRLANPDETPNGQPTRYTEWNKSAVTWGNDVLNDTFVEFEYITRPGEYYLMASKCPEDDPLEDCDNPTFLEMSLIPLSNTNDLTLSCNEVPNG